MNSLFFLRNVDRVLSIRNICISTGELLGSLASI
jgi:hypothetical protein